jgi:anti-anti-sigma factor
MSRHALQVSDLTGFRLTREPARAILEVRGPLDNLSGPAFERLVERCLAGPDRVEEIAVDLASSPFVTAAGFRVLLSVANRSTEAGCRLWLEHPRPLVASTIHTLGLESVLC